MNQLYLVVADHPEVNKLYQLILRARVRKLVIVGNAPDFADRVRAAGIYVETIGANAILPEGADVLPALQAIDEAALALAKNSERKEGAFMTLEITPFAIDQFTPKLRFAVTEAQAKELYQQLDAKLNVKS